MIQITRTKEVFHRTLSGRSWSSKPTVTETAAISRREYDNMAGDGALRFWNGFFGGTCRAERGYTCAGFIPVRITRVNPDRSEKIVEHFSFAYIDE